MTMPHLMNCEHMPDGWCLACVGKLHADAERYRWLRKVTEADDTILPRGPGAELDADIDEQMQMDARVGAA